MINGHFFKNYLLIDSKELTVRPIGYPKDGSQIAASSRLEFSYSGTLESGEAAAVSSLQKKCDDLKHITLDRVRIQVVRWKKIRQINIRKLFLIQAVFQNSVSFSWV